jgi:serine/threonine-protein kinase
MAIGRLGRYEVLERIGEGGMGVVFRARDVQLDRAVAIKVLPEEFQADREHRERLMHEARALAALNHPHVAICFECGEAAPEPPDLVNPGRPGPHPGRALFLAMEYVPGRDLGTMLREGVLPLRQALDLGLQIASGLDAAHRAGVIHRDLTPSNIRVTPEGEAKILDFGIARTTRRPDASGVVSNSSSTGTVVGTAGYMSPQQAQGERVDERSDLFSFGVILYLMVTGRPPFEGKTPLEVLYAVANSEPHPLARFASGIPPELQRIVGKLLQKNPEDRYQSAHEALTDLQRLRETLPATSRRLQQVMARASARRGALVGIGAMLLAVAVLLAWPTLGPGRSAGHRVAMTEFKNLTGDGRLDYLGVGLSMDLLDALVQSSDLVVARGMVRDARGQPEEDPRAVARDLGAAQVITGQIRSVPLGLRLYVQIVDGRRGFVRWARGFDFTPASTYALRQALAQELTARLGAGLELSSRPARPAPAPPPSAAFEAYLRGLDALSDAGEPLARDRALAAFEQAIAADSGFAEAWAGYARALLWLYDRDRDPPLMQRAVAAADRAVALGPDLVQTHIARARVNRDCGRSRESIDELKQVVQGHPNNDEAWLLLGPGYRKVGDLDEAEAAYRRAIALRPEAWRNWNSLGSFLMMVRADYPRAREAYQKVVELAPQLNRGYEGLGNAFVLEGRYRDAITAFRRLPKPVTEAAQASNIATAYFFAGQNGPARQYYLMAVTLEPNDAMLRLNLGDCYARQGQADEARAQYRTALDLTAMSLRVDPDNVRLSLQLALAYAKVGARDSALATVEACAARTPNDDAEVLHELAKVHALLGRTRDAVAALSRMVQLGSPPRLFRDEDEFRGLRSDAEFQRLVAANKP